MASATPRRIAAFRNWAGNQVCVPHQILKPGSPEEVAAIVRRAADTGLAVKAVGAGHSFTDAACTQRVRSELDPAGTFANSYTDRVLGPIA